MAKKISKYQAKGGAHMYSAYVGKARRAAIAGDEEGYADASRAFFNMLAEQGNPMWETPYVLQEDTSNGTI